MGTAMVYPLCLSSDGGIVTRWDVFTYQRLPIMEEPLALVPFVETISVPQFAVDPAALYEGRPEELVTLTYSSGAAITFFCDSEAGGSNSSGDGSFENPWRSLLTASSRLACYDCLLTGFDFVQLKVRGDVDYLPGSGGLFAPLVNSGRLVVTGWGESCNLNNHCRIGAGYASSLTITVKSYSPDTLVNCTVLAGSGDNDYARGYNALNCRLEGRAQFYNVLYNCSGGSSGRIWASTCYGGEFSGELGSPPPLGCDYLYSAMVEAAAAPNYYGQARGCALELGSACHGARVYVLQNRDFEVINATGISGGYYISDPLVSICVSARHRGSEGSAAAMATGIAPDSGTVVNGGQVRASAAASALWEATGSRGDASAYAYAAGIAGTSCICSGAVVTLDASATADLTGQQPEGKYSAIEEERIVNCQSKSWEMRIRYYSGAVLVSSNTQSG